VPDQQLNGCLHAEQAFRPHPQRGDKVFEARSVPVGLEYVMGPVRWVFS
jgi:hypothetical protein